MKKIILIQILTVAISLVSCHNKHDEVIEYIQDKYNAKNINDEMTFVLNDADSQFYVHHDLIKILGYPESEILGVYVDNKYIDTYIWINSSVIVTEVLTVDSINTTIKIKLKQ